ncbi:MAG: hypothetical protein AAB495_01505 [Patescibacteria group bacterium]
MEDYRAKTPRFTKALDAILEKVSSGEKVCTLCEKQFEIAEEDIGLYRSLHVPPPTLCPDCRRRKRHVFVNYTTLFKRKCDAPEHSEECISMMPENAPYPVYDYAYWWSDAWDPMSFGREADAEKSFFEDFGRLFEEVPQAAITRDPSSTNSDYTAYGFQQKNCYYVFGGMQSEDVSYGNWAMMSRQCVDVLLPISCENGTHLVFSEKCYNCHYSYFSRDCMDSRFLYDCRNCTDCFGCVNLRNKKFCFLNEQLTEKEYKERIAKIDFGSRSAMNEYSDQFWKLVKESPIRATRNEKVINSTGNYLEGTKDCKDCYWIRQSENCRYSEFSVQSKDCSDFTLSITSERLYETAGASNQVADIKFSYLIRMSQDVEYSMQCYNCQHCFGCIGLRNKKYCIFNRQYEESEYWKIVDALKMKMLERGEYGEFFPMRLSQFPYNASFANITYPTGKKEALLAGAWWNDEEVSAQSPHEQFSAKETPDSIKDASDELLQKVLTSEGNGKPFRVLETELAHYRKNKIPLPLLSPHERLINRFAYVNYFRTFSDKCYHCGIEIKTSIATADGYKPYCEACYQSEII